MLKVLILADQPNWIINKVVDRLIEGIPCNFTKKFYTLIPPEEFLQISSDFDLIHYSNWDLSWHLSIINQIKTPLLLGVRSHRWDSFVPNLPKIIKRNNFYVQVLNKELLKDFPKAKVIPNGIFEQFKPKKKFIVGFSGTPDEYKGFNMVKQACYELGVRFLPATGDISLKKMPDYYRKINLLVSASIEEGHCNPIHECMAMNIPVITTNTSAVKNYNLIKIERSVEGIKKGILKFYTQPQVEHLSWQNICRKFFDYYYEILSFETNQNQNLLRNEYEFLSSEYFNNCNF